MELRDVDHLPTVLTAEPVAELLGVSTDLLYRLVRDEPESLQVQPFRLGRALRWPTAPLLAALGLPERAEAPACAGASLTSSAATTKKVRPDGTP